MRGRGPARVLLAAAGSRLRAAEPRPAFGTTRVHCQSLWVCPATAGGSGYSGHFPMGAPVSEGTWVVREPSHLTGPFRVGRGAVAARGRVQGRWSHAPEVSAIRSAVRSSARDRRSLVVDRVS